MTTMCALRVASRESRAGLQLLPPAFALPLPRVITVHRAVASSTCTRAWLPAPHCLNCLTRKLPVAVSCSCSSQHSTPLEPALGPFGRTFFALLQPNHSSPSSLLGCLPGDPSTALTLATQTLPAIQAPHPHFPRRFQPSLTPPYNNDPKPDRPWSPHRGQGGSDDIFPMSNLPAGTSRSEQRTPQMSPIQPYPAMQPPYRSPREASINPLVSLPPLRQLSKTPPTPSDRRHGNSFGVHSMLNPPTELAEQHRGRRRSASQMESPSPVETHHPQSLPSISRPTSVDSAQSTQDEPNHPRPFQPPGRPLMRHMLSPKLHRTQSLSMLNPPTGTIDAHQSPFLTANTRPSEIVTSQTALPTPPIGGRTAYFPVVPPTAPTPPPNMIRTDIRRPSVNFPQSGSASPIAQYSPYSQPASVASSQYDIHSIQGQYGPGPAHAQMHESRHRSISMDSERNSMIPMAPSSQSSVQLMTITSQHGPPREILVETQTASKGADEKRRRNAGASARFRARRKEKEREASMSISRLEQNVRDSTEDAEYYRSERDFWRSIAMQVHPDRHCPRPQSPRLRRISAAPSRAPSSTTGHGSEASYDDYEEDVREEERNVRRRTSSYHPALGPHPTDTPPSAMDSNGYAAPAFPPMNHTAAQSTSQGPHNSPHQHGRVSGLQQPSPEQPLYRDPFVSDPASGRYEHRTWTSENTQTRKH
ncbi:hypothetical protein BDW02DRAFT_647844 [Decorospora gaudefroyi]|uniref:BZIP domain-containing protein n=1 Tax=Decorospora gaudefroyi TaxID=184978 RepID=A0A6A5K8R9_9PLEO|nr:hypothetical protein BDW02DRAFT_647844 [Decorospora gaudefroyi]